MGDYRRREGSERPGFWNNLPGIFTAFGTGEICFLQGSWNFPSINPDSNLTLLTYHICQMLVVRVEVIFVGLSVQLLWGIRLSGCPVSPIIWGVDEKFDISNHSKTWLDKRLFRRFETEQVALAQFLLIVSDPASSEF